MMTSVRVRCRPWPERHELPFFLADALAAASAAAPDADPLRFFAD